MTRNYGIALALSVLALLGTRTWWASRHGFNADEGLVAEISDSIAHGRGPVAGAMIENGFAPLTAPPLPLYASALFSRICPYNALRSARIWAILLQIAALLVAAALARRLAGPMAGLAAAWAFALAPSAAWLGSFAFYHHLGAVALLTACFFWVAWIQEGAEPNFWGMAIAAALAPACAYWLWWLPAGLLALLAARGDWRRALQGSALALAALASSLAWNYGSDPESFVGELAWMGHLGRDAGPAGLKEFFLSGGRLSLSMPLLFVGLIFLAASLRRQVGLLIFPFYALFMGLFEPLRQRANLAEIPYSLLIALPLAIASCSLAFQASGPKRWALGALAILALAWQPKTYWLDLLALDGQRSGELCKFVESASCGDELVIGQSNYGWRLQGKPCIAEPAQLAAWQGMAAAFMPGNLPHSRFTREASLENSAYLVCSRSSVIYGMREPGTRLVFLEADRERWPMVWDNGSFRVFANPRRVGWQAAMPSVIPDNRLYAEAEADARAQGRPELAEYAHGRLISAAR